jgi:hypothetical protein
LRKELISPLEALNGLRNKIAHRLDFQLSEDDERDLMNCTPKYVRDAMLAEEGRAPGPLRFGELLHVLVVNTEVVRQQHAFNRLFERKASAHLRKVLQRAKPMVDRIRKSSK